MIIAVALRGVRLSVFKTVRVTASAVVLLNQLQACMRVHATKCWMRVLSSTAIMHRPQRKVYACKRDWIDCARTWFMVIFTQTVRNTNPHAQLNKTRKEPLPALWQNRAQHKPSETQKDQHTRKHRTTNKRIPVSAWFHSITRHVAKGKRTNSRQPGRQHKRNTNRQTPRQWTHVQRDQKTQRMSILSCHFKP